MIVEIQNHYADTSKRYEGTPEQIDAQLAQDFPHLGLETDVDEVHRFLDVIDGTQQYSVEIIEDVPGKKFRASGPRDDAEYEPDPWVREGDEPDRDVHQMKKHPPMLGRERKPVK